tara:strand:+ start:123 stop:527 length:405 start_codon:yes stop_codon:yes gene_type:complete
VQFSIWQYCIQGGDKMYYYLEDSAFRWFLLYEKGNKQTFKVEIEYKDVLYGEVNIYYITPKMIVVDICIGGNRRIPIAELWLWLSLDIEKITEKYCRWDVFEYFLTDASNGNDAIKYHRFLRRIIEPRFDSQSP